MKKVDKFRVIDPETLRKKMNMAIAIDSSGYGNGSVAISTPFPGTVLYNKAAELGINIRHTRWSNYTLTKPVYSTKEFELSDIRNAFYVFHNEKEKLQEGPVISDNPLTSFREEIAQWIVEVGQKVQ